MEHLGTKVTNAVYHHWFTGITVKILT